MKKWTKDDFKDAVTALGNHSTGRLFNGYVEPVKEWDPELYQLYEDLVQAKEAITEYVHRRRGSES